MKAYLRKEFIGKGVRVENVYGKIIDETKFSFLIETRNKRKRFFKHNNLFEITFNEHKVKIEGSSIMMRPEERIKIK